LSQPSIKATAFQSVADDLQRLLEQGRLSRDELEASLEAGDLPFVDEKLAPTAWIPIATYARAVELLARIEAPGRREAYLVERGERAAERLAALGIYSQLEATTERIGQRIGHMIVSLAGAMYNFSAWRYEPQGEERGFAIHVEDAAAMPEVSRFATQGFIQYVATRANGHPTRVASRRPAPDTITFLGRPAG
jgi:hypothetical protein